jgi:hypothetical protein
MYFSMHCNCYDFVAPHEVTMAHLEKAYQLVSHATKNIKNTSREM